LCSPRGIVTRCRNRHFLECGIVAVFGFFVPDTLGLCDRVQTIGQHGNPLSAGLLAAAGETSGIASIPIARRLPFSEYLNVHFPRRFQFSQVSAPHLAPHLGVDIAKQVATRCHNRMLLRAAKYRYYFNKKHVATAT